MIKKRTKNHDVDGFVCPAPEKMPVAGAQEGMWPPRKALSLNIHYGNKTRSWRIYLQASASRKDHADDLQNELFLILRFLIFPES